MQIVRSYVKVRKTIESGKVEIKLRGNSQLPNGSLEKHAFAR